MASGCAGTPADPTVGLSFTVNAGLQGQVEVFGFPLAKAGGNVGFAVTPYVTLTAPPWATDPAKVYMSDLALFGSNPFTDIADDLSAGIAGTFTGSVYASINLFLFSISWSWGVKIPVFNYERSPTWPSPTGSGPGVTPWPNVTDHGTTLTFNGPVNNNVPANVAISVSESTTNLPAGDTNAVTISWPNANSALPAANPPYATSETFYDVSKFVFQGNGGSDSLTTVPGANGSGFDIPVDAVNGGSGTDYLQGGDAGNTLIGGGGADTLIGGAGTDELIAGSGTEKIYAGSGTSTKPAIASILGGSGSETLAGGNNANDSIYGGTGTDSITGGAGGTYYIDAGSGKGDTINVASAAGYDSIYGSSGGDNTIDGSSNGHDLIYGGGKGDIIDGGGGADTIYASSGGASQVYGGPDGGNLIYGGGNGDTLAGGGDGVNPAVDTVYGGPGNETLYGGAGADDPTPNAAGLAATGLRYSSGAPVSVGSSMLIAGSGNDVLYGDSSGQNTLYGGAGADILYAGNAGDYLSGGSGGGTLFGGRGADTFELPFTATGQQNVNIDPGAWQDQGQNTLVLKPDAVQSARLLVSVLSSHITNPTSTAITVTNAADLVAANPGSFIIRIDNEQMLVTGVAGNTLTVVRGYTQQTGNTTTDTTSNPDANKTITGLVNAKELHVGQSVLGPASIIQPGTTIAAILSSTRSS